MWVWWGGYETVEYILSDCPALSIVRIGWSSITNIAGVPVKSVLYFVCRLEWLQWYLNTGSRPHNGSASTGGLNTLDSPGIDLHPSNQSFFAQIIFFESFIKIFYDFRFGWTFGQFYFCNNFCIQGEKSFVSRQPGLSYWRFRLKFLFYSIEMRLKPSNLA